MSQRAVYHPRHIEVSEGPAVAAVLPEVDGHVVGTGDETVLQFAGEPLDFADFVEVAVHVRHQVVLTAIQTHEAVVPIYDN